MKYLWTLSADWHTLQHRSNWWSQQSSPQRQLHAKSKVTKNLSLRIIFDQVNDTMLMISVFVRLCAQWFLLYLILSMRINNVYHDIKTDIVTDGQTNSRGPSILEIDNYNSEAVSLTWSRCCKKLLFLIFTVNIFFAHWNGINQPPKKMNSNCRIDKEFHSLFVMNMFTR